jgi:nucleotide-binding universal stress UspA family protein
MSGEMSQPFKILLPVDFSECSETAHRQCIRLVRQLSASVEVVNVWEPVTVTAPETVLVAPATAATLEKEAAATSEEQLGRILQELRTAGVAATASSHKGGWPSKVIVDLARARRSDLIVMGTHGRRGFERALLGSVVERVLRHAPCPVLSVGPASSGAELREVRRILVPVDLSENSEHALCFALNFSRLLGAEVEVVHVWDRPSWFDNQMTIVSDGEKRLLGEVIHENTARDLELFVRESTPASFSAPASRLLSGNPARELLVEIEGGRYDLVVLGTQGRGGIGHLLLGSLAEKLVRLSSKPVITVPRGMVPKPLLGA